MNTNLTISQLFPSKFIKSADIGEPDLVLTISRVQVEELGYGEEKDSKPIMYFEETDQSLVLNKTNAESISQLYGPRIADWLGKKIALFTTEVSFQGKSMLGIRVRLRQPEVEETQNHQNAQDKPANWEE